MFIRLEGGWGAFGLVDLCGDVLILRYTRSLHLEVFDSLPTRCRHFGSRVI